MYMKKDLFKSKESLDQMTEEQILKYRYWFLGKIEDKIQDHKQFLLELDFYILVRFKQTKMEMFERWKQEFSKYVTVTSTDQQAKALLSKISNESLYKLSYDSDLKEIGTFKFIKNINEKSPE